MDSSKAELSSSPVSHRDSMESGGSPSLSPPKDTPSPQSPHSPSGFLRNVKKRESKGKGKEPKGERQSGGLDFHLTPLLTSDRNRQGPRDTILHQFFSANTMCIVFR